MEPSLAACCLFLSLLLQGKMAEELDPFSNEADTDITPSKRKFICDLETCCETFEKLLSKIRLPYLKSEPTVWRNDIIE